MANTVLLTYLDPIFNHGSGGPPPSDSGGSPGEWGTPQRAYITATILVLAAVTMFFMAFVSAYVVRKGSPGDDWQHLSLPLILWLNSAILLASSVVLAFARRRFVAQDHEGCRHFWRIATILGIGFLVGQVVAWRQLVAAKIYLASSPASSFFYAITVAHALHLLVGIAMLLLIAVRVPQWLSLRTAIDVVALYWHFLDALWIFLFLFLLTT